jgi:hypothetical protein
MAWHVPALPRADYESKVSYWYCLLDIPDEEPSSQILRAMAAARLIQLNALPEEEVEKYLNEASR